MRLPPQDYLRECFDYDPDTGVLLWRERPLDHFQSENSWRGFNTRRAGTPALSYPQPRDGRLAGGITYEGVLKNYYQTLVIWKLVTGVEASQDVIHKDGVQSNNRWDNLREATRSEAMASCKQQSGKQVKFKGVTKCGRKYHARISRQGKSIYLGLHDTPELAGAAYAAKAQELFGEFARA